MIYSKPKNGKYVVKGRTWHVHESSWKDGHVLMLRVGDPVYHVETVLPNKSKVRYEAEHPNCSGNLWIDKVLAVEQSLGRPAHPGSIFDPQARALVEDAIAALNMAAATQANIDAPKVARSEAKEQADQDAKDRKVAEALAKLR